MKIIIFTYDRYDSITTSEYFKEHEHIILCHTEDMKKKYIEHKRLYGEIIANNQPKGTSNNRNYALSLMEEGEWALFISDDLVNVYKYKHLETADYELIPENIDANKAFNKTITAKKLIEISKQEIKVISNVSEVTINKCFKKLETIKQQLLPSAIVSKYNIH